MEICFLPGKAKCLFLMVRTQEVLHHEEAAGSASGLFTRTGGEVAYSCFSSPPSRLCLLPPAFLSQHGDLGDRDCVGCCFLSSPPPFLGTAHAEARVREGGWLKNDTQAL